ncbi:hypothetical protein CR513_40605, partial [Mucuna pruriens]
MKLRFKKNINPLNLETKRLSPQHSIDIVGEDGKETTRCNVCNKEYRIGGKRYGTSNLNCHVEKCKKIKFEDIGQMMLDMQGKLKSRKTDNMVLHDFWAALILKHDLPSKFVEYEELRSWIKYLNPNAILISRNTTKVDVLKIYMREKAKVKEELASIPSRISLTSNLWTSCNIEGYISLIAHYVDTNWKLNSKILNFCYMPPFHTGFELSKKVNEFLQKWLICDGGFLHMIEVVAHALDKIRENIKYVKSSNSRIIKFKQWIEILWVVSKCSSKMELNLFDASNLYLDDENYKYCPLVEEWKRAKKMCKFLLSFYDITTLISSTSYPTSNFVRDEDKVIKSMAIMMMDEYNVVLAFGVIFFYLGMRLETLGYCYEKELKARKLQTTSKIGRTQLDTYLNEPNLDFYFMEQMDVLQ